MIWAGMLAYITGTVDQELQLRKEYLAAENRILKAQIQGRLLLSDAEKATRRRIKLSFMKWLPKMLVPYHRSGHLLEFVLQIFGLTDG